jgi:hypothetical protein
MLEFCTVAMGTLNGSCISFLGTKAYACTNSFNMGLNLTH